MVDVLVQVFDRGELRRAVVPVEEQCFDPERVCWKAIANIRAAVILEMSFTSLERCAKHGLRPEDKIRLREMYGRSGETDSSTPPSTTPAAPLRMTDAGDEGDGGPMWSYIRDSASSAPTENEREEKTE